MLSASVLCCRQLALKSGPAQPSQPHETFHKSSRLAKCHSVKLLCDQASLDRGIKEGSLSAAVKSRA